MSTEREMDRGARFSDCRRYRYHLWRVWDEQLPRCVFVGVNPSTADELKDDPTIRKCIGFARRWGFGAIDMINLFAYRSTDQLALLKARDPIGPGNDGAFDLVLGGAGRIVWAWGRGKSAGVRRFIDARVRHPKWYPVPRQCEVGCLGRTDDGYPRHPLMLAYTTEFNMARFGRAAS